MINRLYLQDIISEHPERFFVAEIVREKIFLQYRQEIPYVCQVRTHLVNLLPFYLTFLVSSLWNVLLSRVQSVYMQWTNTDLIPFLSFLLQLFLPLPLALLNGSVFSSCKFST